MVLDIIKSEIERYKKIIVTADYGELYKWEALQNFHENWDIEATDFKTMYDNSFHNKDTNNLWANPHWFPKAVMLKFIEYDVERVHSSDSAKM